MNFEEFQRIQTRRSFFRDCAGGLGSIALWHLMAREGWTASTEKAAPNASPLAVKPPHFPAKAKNVILLYMDGGPKSDRSVRSQAGDEEMGGPGAAAFHDQGFEIGLHQADGQSLGEPAHVPALRAKRH